MAERLLVILPTFNETENLERIIPQILTQVATSIPWIPAGEISYALGSTASR